MATKVKGEAIKEGSIPLSALADEVKDKIENAGSGSGGADWNAQEGEAGYIENKPFGISYIGDTHFGNDEWQTYEYIYLYVAKRSHNDTYLDDSGYIRLYDGMSHTFYLDGQTGGITVHNSNGFLRIISQDYFDTEEQAAEFLNNVLKVVTFKELNNVFIEDTVIKTTPQTLSDDAKNQALANLGIDPVVWKYICNPFIIELDRNTSEVNNAIPEELSDIIYQNGKFNSIVLSTVLVKVYYIPEDGDEVVWKVERITSYTQFGTVILSGEEFGYDPDTRKFVY